MAMSLAAYEAGTLTRWLQARFRIETRVTMYIQKVVNKTTLTAGQRVRIAGQLLQDKTRVNLSRPVRKIRKTKWIYDANNQKVKFTATYVDPRSRSKPGEFPRADTTRLMKDIFHNHDPGGPVSRIGTTLKYGLLLEVKYNRSFLRRTLNEMRASILLILQGGNVSGVQ
jgi:hypothetical protein